MEVGTVVEGKVTGITDFGAFVELDKQTKGMVHISEVAQGYVKNVNDVLKIGDVVKVKILSADKRKISLSIKQAELPMKIEETFEKPKRNEYGSSKNKPKRIPGSLEDKINKFLRESEEKLGALRRNTESKRGGRGGRRA